MNNATEKIVYKPSDTSHWKNLFPEKSMMLGAHNLNPGEELIAEMESIDPLATIKNKVGKEEQITSLHFKDAPPMCLNITNAKTIANLYGDYYEDWIGKSIQLYAARVKAFGSEVTALRIREAIPDTDQDVSEYEIALRDCESMADLQQVFTSIPKHLKPKVAAVKDEMKEKLNA